MKHLIMNMICIITHSIYLLPFSCVELYAGIKVYGKHCFEMVAVPGGVETRYSCCQGVMGTPGCQVFEVRKWHLERNISITYETFSTVTIISLVEFFLICLSFNSYMSMIPSAWMGLCLPFPDFPQMRTVRGSTLWIVKWWCQLLLC